MYLTLGLHRGVQQTPDAVMTVFGERTRTFAEVAHRVARLAGSLQALGVGKGDRVAILSMNSDRYHEYLLAVPWADAVLNPVNIRWSAAEIVYSLADSETVALLIDDNFAPILPALLEGFSGLKAVISCGDGPAPDGVLRYEDLIAGSEPVEDARRGGADLAGVFYTGGTTGFPKGVMLSHANMITSSMGAAATGYVLGPQPRLLHAAPMFHIAGLSGWGSVMLLGGAHVIIPAFDPVAVVTAIARERVTDAVLVPAMLQAIVDHPDSSRHDTSSLRSVLYGASPISEALLQRAMQAFPTASFTQGYGMTELSPIATLLGPEEHRSGDRLSSAGRAAPHAEVRIVDESDREVPRGDVGEVVARGANVMLGYWNRSEETAAALRGGWMHTGDAGYMDDEGYLFIVDRLKDMVVTGGENVYSVEVEKAIAQHPAVAACAVIGVPDAQWGERVHAFVVLKPGREATVDEIRDHAATLIARYKVPRTVDVVDALPVSGTGKVLKRELRQRYWGDQERQVH